MSQEITIGDIGLAKSSVRSFVSNCAIEKFDADSFSRNKRITEIIISSANCQLPDGIFAGCTSLSSLRLPALTKIDNKIFGKSKRSYPAKLKRIVFDDCTEDIGCILSGLDKLEEVHLPAGLRKLTKNALNGVKRLSSLDVPRNAVIEDGAFQTLDSLIEVSCRIIDTNTNLGLQELPNLSSVTILNPTGIGYCLPANALADLEVSNLTFESGAMNLTGFAQGALSGLKSIATIDFSNSQLTSLPTYAFASDSNLSTVYLNEAYIRSLESSAFAGIQHVAVIGTQNLHHIEYPGAEVDYQSPFSRTAMTLGPSAFYKAEFHHPIEMIMLSAGNAAFEFSTISAAFLQFGKSPQNALLARTFADCSRLKTAIVTQVSSFDEFCFFNCSQLENFDTDEQFYAMSHAFAGCSSLNAFPIEQLRHADDFAFAGCTSLFKCSPTIDLSHVQFFGKSAFDSAISCDTVVVDGQLLAQGAIADGAFSNCNIAAIRLQGLSLEQLQQILQCASGNLADMHMKLVTRFGLGSSSEFVLDDAVIREDGKGNAFDCLVIEDGVLKMVDTLALDYRQFMHDSIVPYNVHSIGENAFSSFSELKRIDLNNVTAISENAFADCINLSGIIAPKLQQVGKNAFNGCSNLTDFDFSNVQDIAQRAFYGCTSLHEVHGDNIACIREYAFSKCRALSSVSASQLLILEQLAFNDCISLQTVDFSLARLELVSECAFLGCKSLQSLKLGSNVQTLDTWALKDTSPELSVIFADAYPDDVFAAAAEDNSCGLTVGAKVGIQQNGYTRMLLQATQPDELFRLQDTARRVALFKAVGSPDDIYVTDGHGTLIGIKDENVRPGAEDAVINGSEITAIAMHALATTRKLKSIDIRPSVRLTIRSKAFEHNTSLKTVKLGLNVNSIAADAFDQCAVEHVVLPPLTTAGGYGLNKSYSLSNLEFSAGTAEIAANAMKDCQPVLTNVKLPTTLSKIGNYAFAETTSNFPNISEINLTSLTNLTSIGDYAFYNSIQSMDDDILEIPAKVTKIGTAAFGYSEDAWTFSLSSFKAPNKAYGNNVQDIGPSAFIFNGFRDVIFNRNTPALTSIGEYAFAYPKKKCSIWIPSSIKRIGENAFKKNIILNPDYVTRNSISIDVDTDAKILSIINALSSPDFTAPNTVGVTDHTCLLATGSNAVENQSFLYALNGKLNLCPTSMRIDIQNRKLVSVTDKNITTSLIPGYVKTIGTAAYKDCTKLVSVSAVNADIQLQASAFYNCNKLTAINGPNAFYIKYADPYLFYNCQSIQNVRLLSSASYIGKCAFYNCKSLTSVQDEDAYDYLDYWQLSDIGPSAFLSCSRIKTFAIPHTIANIGAHAFDGCSNLSRIRIDLTTTQFKARLSSDDDIGAVVSRLFAGVRKDASCEIMFNDVTYMNDGNVKLDDRLVGFRDIDEHTRAISSIDTFELEESGQDYVNLSAISQIDNFTFRNVSDLRMINILPSEDTYLTLIGDYAFSKCDTLQYVNGNILSCSRIGIHAFDGCVSLTSMQLDLQNLEKVASGAFAKSGLKKLVFYDTSGATEYEEDTFLPVIKSKIGFDTQHNLNPMSLPEDCLIEVIDQTEKRIAIYDCQLNSLMHTDIDINRNQMVFVDKDYTSVKPLLLVKPAHANQLPTIAKNEFHVNIIGRWK